MLLLSAVCFSALLWPMVTAAAPKDVVISDGTTTTHDPRPVEDKCKGVKCTEYKHCEVDPITKRPECVCNQACTLEYRPVCGSDDVTYDNECMLHRHACLIGTDIRVKHQGHCETDPCHGTVCAANKICVVKPGNRPKCECTTACSTIYKPVCGPDNKTYGNECEMLAKFCVKNKNASLAYLGKCRGVTMCSQVSCPEGKICRADMKRVPKCVCREACTKELKPVCGSNGKTYDNKCLLLKDACMNYLNIRVEHVGECRE